MLSRGAHIASPEFTFLANRLRQFFASRGFVEVHAQSRLSIMAACEDVHTLRTFDFGGQLWPLPQTGQMWLEHELLRNPDWPGCFTLTTSYRDEPNPIDGRHQICFPMFEFEHHGNMDDLKALEMDLCEYLGFGSPADFKSITYHDACHEYMVHEIEAREENMMGDRFGPVVLLTDFPNYTNPFWNMKRKPEGNAAKIDVLIDGQETIGSAERSCDPDQMYEDFHSLDHGMYANKLYNAFGRDRVRRELDQYLALDFFPRSGAGIGMTRLLDGMKNKTKQLG